MVEVEIDGTSYGTTVISSTGNWNNYQTFSLDDVAIENDSTSVIRLRFSGAGLDLDRFEFVQLAGAVLKGDVDLDGDVDFQDIPWFVAALLGATGQAEADCDCDGDIDFNDVPVLVDILLGN